MRTGLAACLVVLGLLLSVSPLLLIKAALVPVSCLPISCASPYQNLLVGLNQSSTATNINAVQTGSIPTTNLGVDDGLTRYLATATAAVMGGRSGTNWVGDDGTIPCSTIPTGSPSFKINLTDPQVIRSNNLDVVNLYLDATLQQQVCNGGLFALISVDDVIDSTASFLIDAIYDDNTVAAQASVTASSVRNTAYSCISSDTNGCVGEVPMDSFQKSDTTVVISRLVVIKILNPKPIKLLRFTVQSNEGSAGKESLLIYSVVGVLATPPSPAAATISAPTEAPLVVAQQPAVVFVPPPEAAPQTAPEASPVTPVPSGISSCGNLDTFVTGSTSCEDGQLKVNGSVNVPSSSQVSIRISGTTAPAVVVDGCVQISSVQSNISVVLNSETTNSIVKNETRSIVLIRSEAQCLSGSFSSAEVLCSDQALCSSNCLSADQVTTTTTLTLLFTVGCDNNLNQPTATMPWWGILIIVLAAVAVVVIVVIVVLSNKKFRQAVFPYSGRREQKLESATD